MLFIALVASLIVAILTYTFYGSIIRSDTSPVASFTPYAPAEFRVNETITFDASASYDSDGVIVSYEWNFGDGTKTIQTDPVVLHAYLSTGNYTVTLTVTDNDGLTDTTSTLLTIFPSLPRFLATYVQTWEYPFEGSLKGIIEDPQSGHVMEAHKFFLLDSSNSVAEFIPDYNLFRKWDIPTPDSGASFGLSIMNLRRVFFTEPNANKIGMLDEPRNTFTEWDVPQASNGESQLYDIVVKGTPGPVYFTDRGGDRVGYLSPNSNQIMMWSLPKGRNPSGIALSDGAVYFLENGNRIGQLNLQTNVITEWTVPISFGSWSDYIVASQGFLFVTSHDGNKIGRFDPSSNLFTEWIVPTGDGAPKGLLVDPLDPSQRVYFTESKSGKMGLLDTLLGGTNTTLPVATITANFTSTIVTPITTTTEPIEETVSPTTSLVNGVANDTFIEWLLPVPKVGLEALAPSMFRLIFTHSSGIVGRFQTVVKTVTEYALPPDCYPQHLSVYFVGSGSVFFTERDNRIASLNYRENSITEWTLPTPEARPFALAPSYSGQTEGVIFFTEEGANRIASFNPETNILKEWNIPTPESMPRGLIFAGSSLYFAEFGANKIGKLDLTSNTFTEWTIPTPSSGTMYVTLWRGGIVFTESYANKIGMLDPLSNTFQEWTIPTAESFPTEMIGSESGHLYFAENGSHKIGSLKKYNFGTVFEEWSIPTTNKTVSTSIASIDRQVRNIFFLEPASNKIGFLDPDLDETVSEIIVEPEVFKANSTSTQVEPIETLLTPEVRSVAVSWTTVIGEVSFKTTIIEHMPDGFVKWAIPTSGSKPLKILNTDGFGVFFTESGANKIGRISGSWF